MLTVSAELAEAITSPARTVTARVAVDWWRNGFDDVDDISDRVTAVTVTRTAEGTVPDDVAVTDGAAAGTATVDLCSGDPELSTAQYWSRWSPRSPLAGWEPRARPLRIEAEFDTTTGPQRVPLLDGGRVQALPVSASEGAKLDGLDARDRLRTLVTLPAFLAAPDQTAGPWTSGDVGAPGLEASWVASYVLWKAGFTLSPPPRSTCVLWAPCHGSLQPMLQRANVGTSGLCATAGFDIQRPAFCDGPWFLAATPLDGGILDGSAKVASGSGLFGASGRSAGRIELWTKPDVGTGSGAVRLQPDGHWYESLMVTLDWNYDGTTSITMVNDATTRIVAGPTVTYDGQWHRLGVHWSDTSGSATFVWDEAPTTVTFTPTPVGSWAYPDEVTASLISDCPTAELHVDAGLSVGVSWHPMPDAWTPTAECDRLQNRRLAGIWPAGPMEAWELLRELVAPELGLVHISAAGMPRVWSRARLASTAGQTVQRSITATSSLLDCGYDDTASQIRTSVRCEHAGLASAARAPLWELDDVVGVAPGRTWTREIDIAATPPSPLLVFGSVVLAGETAPTVVTATYAVSSGFIADGYGVFQVEVLSITPTDSDPRTRIRVSLTNTATRWMWFVGGTAEPDLRVEAAAMVKGVTLSRDAIDADAVAEFGDLPLSLSAGRWCQTAGLAEGRCRQLLGLLASGRYVTLAGVPVQGDPRLELWDRVELVDDVETGYTGEVLVEGITTTIGPGECTQELTVHPAPTLALLGGLLGDGILGGD